MIAIIISIIALTLIIILAIIKTIKPKIAKILYLTLIGISIIGFWILSSEFLEYTDTSYGFRTASNSSGRWFLFALPAFIIIGLAEGLTNLIEITRTALYNERPDVKADHEAAMRVLRMSKEEFIEYMKEKGEL